MTQHCNSTVRYTIAYSIAHEPTRLSVGGASLLRLICQSSRRTREGGRGEGRGGKEESSAHLRQRGQQCAQPTHNSRPQQQHTTNESERTNERTNDETNVRSFVRREAGRQNGREGGRKEGGRRGGKVASARRGTVRTADRTVDRSQQHHRDTATPHHRTNNQTTKQRTQQPTTR